MVSLVKTGQRVSVHWKRGWQAYCQSFGTGMNDPARYNQEFITGFFDYAGQLAEAQLSFGGGSLPFGGGEGMKRTLVSGSMPPAKRFAKTEPGVAPSGALADRVKALQRRDQETKEAWWSFCDDHLGGVRDPARHPADILHQFLEQHE